MIKRKDLEGLYWGSTCMPNMWHTVEEIAKQKNLSSSYIRTALNGYGIPTRTDSEELHREVWKLLEDDFGLVFGSDFHYNTKLQIYNVDFLIVYEEIGIRIVDTLPVRHSEESFIGDSFLVKISSHGGVEEVSQALRKILLSHKIKARNKVEDHDDNMW